MGDESCVFLRFAARFALLPNPVAGGERADDIKVELLHKSENATPCGAFL
jgi:hypothetical protein